MWLEVQLATLFAKLDIFAYSLVFTLKYRSVFVGVRVYFYWLKQESIKSPLLLSDMGKPKSLNLDLLV